ncbi:WD40 repeat domain-containing protein [Anabaena subtropica]|uniref:NB-ARC domain-containing protein n=1 Tax=Anabaena subtropica FACHB-260 TaxID=2692884 RepID=A0ABR8CQW8_9NOST|nr:WD40 repeat domain-containing protein [Anabaena subtropica]MBD2345278.1 hypothetical protein [Anabaena subtropica FACHB-260]
MDLEQAIVFTDTLFFDKFGEHLSDLQQAMLRESWSWQRQSYDKIAETYSYSPIYLKHDVGPKLWKRLSEVLGEKVNKTNFRAAIERQFNLENRVSQPEKTVLEVVVQTPEITIHNDEVTATKRQDWGEAIDVSFFYGRQQELTELQQWIVEEKCRLIGLLGMGGMGKTSISVKLGQHLQNDFECVIWRSLRNAPPIQETLTELLTFLSLKQEQDIPETVEGKISRLMYYLRSHRCLLVLDNFETILQGGTPHPSTNLGEVTRRSTGAYCVGYEGYGELLKQIGETIHQSCLVLTSREKPPEMGILEGASLPVRSLLLRGLEQTQGQELLNLKGNFQGSAAEWSQLIDYYSGNPLALKIVAATIQNLFDGSISDFLQHSTIVFGNIYNLIEQQFIRLSELEKTVIYWLAIYREAATFRELLADIFPAISVPKLIEILESLEQRSLIEKSAAQFSLLPVVMEYVTEQLLEQICQELCSDLTPVSPPKHHLFQTHALLKAQSKDYIRETQIRFLLQPAIARLLNQLPGQITIEDFLIGLLTKLRGKTSLETGYAGGNVLNLLCQRQTCLQNYDFSHLTIWQAYLQRVNLHNINFAHADLGHSIFAETLGIVFGIAFSPDGTLLATGDAEGVLRLWQVATGQPLLNFTGHIGWVWSVAFSPDGQTLASCSSDKTIRLWSVNTGECQKILQGHTSSIWSVAFSADGQTLASGSDEANVRLWDISTGECRQILSGQTGSILSVAFSADGQTLASGRDDGTIQLWDMNTGECHHVCYGHTDRVWSVAFSGDHTLASGSADRTIRLWDIHNGNCLNILDEHSDRVRSVSFSPDAQTLVSGSDDQTVKLWSVRTGQCLNTLRGHSNSVFSVTYNADGQTLASGSTDQTVRFWHSHTGRCLKTLKGYTNSVFFVVFSPQGDTLASGSTDQTVRLWDLKTSSCSKTFIGHSGWVTSVAFHPQGHLLASSSVDQSVRLWSVSTGKCLKTLLGHRNWVESVTFSPDGEILASSGDDQTIRLWSVSTGECLNIFHGHTSWIWAVAFSLDGKILASSSEDQTIRLWSISTGECLNIFHGHTSKVQSVAFSPDGEILSSGSSDQTIRLWSVSTGECLKTLQGHDNSVWSVAFSPDGEMLVSNSLDQTVKLWNINTGTCRKTLPVLTHTVRSSIALSQQNTEQVKGYIFASGSHNGTIKIWDAQTGQCVKTLHPDKPYKGTNITNVTGITIAQRLALLALGAVET